MKTLGIDPGSSVTGWGLVEGSIARPSLVSCGEIRLSSPTPFHRRLLRLRDELDQVVRRHAPDVAAVEWPFHGVNARSALQLAHARGVVLCVLADHGIEPAEYAPASIKKAVTGSGRADKQQVRSMVERLLRVAGEAVPGSDSADALAVALCHQQSSGLAAAARRAGAPGGSAKGPRTWEALVASREPRRR